MKRTKGPSSTWRGISTSRHIRIQILSAWRSAVILILAAAGLPFGSRIIAQTSYGSIVGTVSDSTGAVVSDAKVSLTNTGTNQTQEARRSASGTYSFVNLNPGTYSLTVSK